MVGAEADKSESEGCLSGVNPKGVGSRGEADKSDGSRAQNAKVSGAKKTVKKRYENILKTKKTTPEEQGARGGKKTVEKRFWISRFAALVVDSAEAERLWCIFLRVDPKGYHSREH